MDSDRRARGWLIGLFVMPLLIGALTGTAEETRSRDRFAHQLTWLPEPRAVPDYAFAERLPGGEKVDHAMLDFRGRVVVLNFWATWCGVCRKEMPKLDALSTRLRDEGLAIDVLALSIDDGIDEAAHALAERGHHALRVFHADQGVLAPLLGVVGVPTTFVVDSEGRAFAMTIGPADWDSAAAVDWLRSLISVEGTDETRVIRADSVRDGGGA